MAYAETATLPVIMAIGRWRVRAHSRNDSAPGRISLFLLSGIFTGANEVGTDLLLVGDIKPQLVAKIIKEFEQTLDQSIRYTIMNDQEFTERREIGDVFLYRILEAKHTMIIDQFRLG